MTHIFLCLCQSGLSDIYTCMYLVRFILFVCFLFQNWFYVNMCPCPRQSRVSDIYSCVLCVFFSAYVCLSLTKLAICVCVSTKVKYQWVCVSLCLPEWSIRRVSHVFVFCVCVLAKVGYLCMCVFVFAKVEYQTDQKLHPSATVCLTLDHWAIKSPSVALPLLPLVPYQMEGRVISRQGL